MLAFLRTFDKLSDHRINTYSSYKMVPDTSEHCKTDKKVYIS